MVVRRAFALLLFALMGCADAASTKTGSTDDAIVGGKASEDASGIVRLYVDGAPSCGGTLIAQDWVLSAAHCIKEYDASDFTAVIGRADLTGAPTRKVIAITPHPQWSSAGLVNDIALYKLEPTKLAATTIKLAACKETLAVGVSVTLEGWGATDPTNEVVQSTILEEATTGTLDCTKFGDDYNYVDASKVVCVGDPDGTRHSCGGDSGGPLFEATTRTQVGLDSFGYRPCGAPGKPSAFTRVEPYLTWIHPTTAGAAGTTCN